MNYSNIFKKQTFLIVGSICLLMIVFVGISYALFSKNLESKELVVKTGDLKVTFTGGNVIGGDIIPLSDSDGMTNGALYSFDIDNTSGKLDTSYTISILTDSSVTGTRLPHSYIRLSYDGATPVTLSSLPVSSGTTDNDKVYILKTSGIAKGIKDDKHNLRVWVSNSVPSNVVGNTVGLKLKVISEVDASD